MRPWNDRDVLASMFGRAVLEQAAAVLAPAGIRLMPLKGVWLQQVAYADPAERRITDVDALVLETEYDAAVRRLMDAGWRWRSSNVSEMAFEAPGMPLPLDLHRRLFTRYAFNMPTADLFARARPDERTFGMPVMMLDPRDAFAHLVGHFVKSRGETGAERFARDIVAVAQATRLEPRALAEHLTLTGLGRAARYALRIAAAHPEARTLCHDVLRCLPRDPVGDALARGCLRMQQTQLSRSQWGALAGFALERSVLHAGVSLTVRWFDRRHDARVSDRDTDAQ